jgi:hypothetical protein
LQPRDCLRALLLKVDKQKRHVITAGGVERDAILLYQIYYVNNDIRVLRVAYNPLLNTAVVEVIGK